MKRFFPILLVLVFALSACSDTTGYAGKYTGTFTFIKDSKTKEGSVRMTNNPLAQNGLLLYGILPLTSTSTTGSYQASSENVEFIGQILETIIGNSNYINTAEEAVKNIKIDATFTGNTLNMDVYYEIQILNSLQTRVEIIKFTGSK